MLPLCQGALSGLSVAHRPLFPTIPHRTVIHLHFGAFCVRSSIRIPTRHFLLHAYFDRRYNNKSSPVFIVSSVTNGIGLACDVSADLGVVSARSTDLGALVSPQGQTSRS